MCLNFSKQGKTIFSHFYTAIHKYRDPIIIPTGRKRYEVAGNDFRVVDNNIWYSSKAMPFFSKLQNTIITNLSTEKGIRMEEKKQISWYVESRDCRCKCRKWWK